MPLVLRLLSIVHNPVFGGGMNVILRLAEPLRERGWETVAMVPDLPEARPGLERMRAAGVPAGTMPLHRVRKTLDPRVHAAFAAGFRREVATMRALIRREKIDLVQAYGDTNPHLALAGHLEGKAVIWQLYDTVTPPPLRRVTMPVVSRLADVVMTWGRALAEAYPGAVEMGERCVTVFPPVDASRFDGSPERRRRAREELGLPEDALVVGTVGNRNPTKGHDELARAVAELRADGRDVWCRALGASSPVHAEHMRAVDATVSELGLGDRMAFMDPGVRVPELLPALDVFVISSVPRSEGMPTVILEAMSCGIPVVSTDVGAVREVVEEGVVGHVVPPLDTPALVGAIAPLLDDAGLRRRLGEAGRRRAFERYDLGRCADVYADAYRVALDHRASR